MKKKNLIKHIYVGTLNQISLDPFCILTYYIIGSRLLGHTVYLSIAQFSNGFRYFPWRDASGSGP